MKDTGIVRRIDVLGRVVIPKEIRKILKLGEGDPVEIYTDKDAIILKKYSHLTPVGDSMYSATAALSKTTGHSASLSIKNAALLQAAQVPKRLCRVKYPRIFLNL